MASNVFENPGLSQGSQLRKVDQDLLNAAKRGDIASLQKALDQGANAQLGISFMFKVHHLYEPSVSVPIIQLLKSRCTGALSKPSPSAPVPPSAKNAPPSPLPSPTSPTSPDDFIPNKDGFSESTKFGFDDNENETDEEVAGFGLDSDHSQGKWECEVCRRDNDVEDVTCKVCTAKKPLGKSYWDSRKEETKTPGLEAAHNAVVLARRMSLRDPSDASEDSDASSSSDEEERREREAFEKEMMKKIEEKKQLESQQRQDQEASILQAPSRDKKKKKKSVQESEPQGPAVMQGSDAEWYASTTSKGKCVKAVQAANQGDFLVRKASKISYQLIVKDGGRAGFFDITLVRQGESFLLDLQGRKHDSLDEVINGAFRRHLIGPNSGSMLYLDHPVIAGKKVNKTPKKTKLSVRHKGFA
eukprot:m.70420 g.70420  ORF g.70420 m.70420 type:complete len:415 (-) comp12131_c0_seq1:56-1300(-)